jgi:hypothetical protein
MSLPAAYKGLQLAMDEQRLALRAIQPNVVLASVSIPASGMQLAGYRFWILTQFFFLSFRCCRTDDLYYLTDPSTSSHGLNSLDIHQSHQRTSF